jgi:predicted nucleotidyltransferase
MMLQSLATVLFGGYQRRILGLLLLHPEQAYHVREIARLTATAPGTLHKELSRLGSVGILERERRGNQLVYRANRSCPIFQELASIMRKTSGLADVIAHALEPVASQVRVAFVFGSVAQGKESADSDIDVMVIGKVGFADVVQLLHPVQSELGREINAKTYKAKEWTAKLAKRDAFVHDVMAKPKIFLIGSEDELGQLARHQPRQD